MTKLPIFSNLPTGALAAIFNNTSTSYKLYWFYAILEAIKENKQEIIINELTAKMIALTWYSVHFYKISLGKQDKLADAIHVIKKITDLKEDDQPAEVFRVILENLERSKELRKVCSNLQRYVPYRFLTPFVEKSLKVVKQKDHSIKNSKEHSIIMQLANESFRNDYMPSCLYRFKSNRSIEIHPVWFRYFSQNIKILEDFCLWNLAKYLQRRNPNMPNIGEKIFAPPTNRKLGTARKFWNLVLSKQELHCVFSNQLIQTNNYSIDHFLPWSFVTHDLLWNLVPVFKEVNSSKSNHIPSLPTYFQGFAALQHDAFHTIYNLKKNRLIEDYCLLFDSREEEIASFSQDIFSEKLRNHIAPLSQIAENSGFLGEWVY